MTKPTITAHSPTSEDEARKQVGASVQRFMRRYALVQKTIAEIIGVSQPQISYMLGTSKADRPRSFTPWELFQIELHVKRSTNPDLVFGEILRDAGMVVDADDIYEQIASHPYFTDDDRDDLILAAAVAEVRYRARNGLPAPDQDRVRVVLAGLPSGPRPSPASPRQPRSRRA